MRYLSILIAVSLTMLFTSACQEESQPVAKEVPKVIQQQQKEAATAAATAEENTEKLMEQMKEEEHKSIEHAKAQAHEMMDASHEKMAEMHDGMCRRPSVRRPLQQVSWFTKRPAPPATRPGLSVRQR